MRSLLLLFRSPPGAALAAFACLVGLLVAWVFVTYDLLKTRSAGLFTNVNAHLVEYAGKEELSGWPFWLMLVAEGAIVFGGASLLWVWLRRDRVSLPQTVAIGTTFALLVNLPALVAIVSSGDLLRSAAGLARISTGLLAWLAGAWVGVRSIGSAVVPERQQAQRPAG